MITVQPGDTLGRIAFENDTTVEALIQANVDRYPSLRDQPDALEVGWLLSVPADFDPGASGAARPRYSGLRFGL
ncbi:MAG: LysM peptidoglycan-binding domain-containing protein, partial [Anaerolineae bacterium]|nr:LysM peptidoglycan-binding domain-containing protein [Anaerolineae bacterium]